MIRLVCDSHNFLHNLLKLATFFFNSVPLREFLDHYGQQVLFSRAVYEINFCEMTYILNTQSFLFKLSDSLYPFPL